MWLGTFASKELAFQGRNAGLSQCTPDATNSDHMPCDGVAMAIVHHFNTQARSSFDSLQSTARQWYAPGLGSCWACMRFPGKQLDNDEVAWHSLVCNQEDEH